VLLLIPFHAAAVFYTGELRCLYVWGQPPKECQLAGLVQFLYQWHMPLLFISGWLCLRHYPCSCGSPAALPAGTPCGGCLFPCWLAFCWLVLPQVYCTSCRTNGIDQTNLQFLSPFLMEFGQSVF